MVSYGINTPLLQAKHYSTLFPGELLAGLRGGLIDVVGAGLADRREDFLGDPGTERLTGRGVAPEEHLVGLRLGEQHNILAEALGLVLEDTISLYLLELTPCLVLGADVRYRLTGVAESRSLSNLSSDEQEVMLGMADQNVQLGGTQ